MCDFLTLNSIRGVYMEILGIKPISVKKIGEVKIYKYDITYKTPLGRKHKVRVQILKHNGFKGLILDNSFNVHSDLIGYLVEKTGITTLTPKEASELIVKFNFS